jgi:hypothetical protein
MWNESTGFVPLSPNSTGAGGRRVRSHGDGRGGRLRLSVSITLVALNLGWRQRPDDQRVVSRQHGILDGAGGITLTSARYSPARSRLADVFATAASTRLQGMG